MPLSLREFDRRALDGAGYLVGVDEVGRGCLAGPVVAAAVRCSEEFYQSAWCRRRSRMVKDSKLLSAARRAEVVAVFEDARQRGWIQVSIASATVEEIEQYNIYQATALAMRRALGLLRQVMDPLLDGTDLEAAPVLVDGRPIRSLPVAHRAVVKGDRQSLAIALAGIHAKEWRDARMKELEQSCPGYGFGIHKGYGTAQHLEALRELGPSRYHRPTFLRKFHERETARPKTLQDSLF